MAEKKLFIIRHGKSSWEVEYVDDIDRPLTERGVKDAYAMGKRLADRQLIPDWIYTSPANRAFHTAIIMSRVMEIPEESIFVKRELYMPGLNEIENCLFDTPEHVTSLALFGHNPSFTSYANRYLKDPLDNLPTAGVVILTFEAKSWKDLTPESVTSEFVDCPKKHR